MGRIGPIPAPWDARDGLRRTVWGMSRRRRNRGQEAVLITDARQSRIRNYNYRRHTYALLQWSRIPMLLLAAAAFLWWDLAWLAALMTVLSVPMPWIAVVIANAQGEAADKRAPRVYKPGVIREQNRRWEEEQRANARALAERGESDAESPGNLPAVVQPGDPAGGGRGFDPSMVIDMEPGDGEGGGGADGAGSGDAGDSAAGRQNPHGRDDGDATEGPGKDER